MTQPTANHPRPSSVKDKTFPRCDPCSLALKSPVRVSLRWWGRLCAMMLFGLIGSGFPIHLTGAQTPSPPASAPTASSNPEEWLLRGGTVLVYHRFGEDSYPTTSISTERFTRHVETLIAQNVNVVPVSQIVDALRTRTPLAPNTLGITIDDGFASFARVGWPILKRHNLPVTLFISTSAHNRGGADIMSWQELQELAADPLVTIALAGTEHVDLSKEPPEAVRRQLRQARNDYLTRFESQPPPFFAYPYGRTSTTVQQIVRQQGFSHGFGQHSSVIHAGSHPLFLGRFSMSDSLLDDRYNGSSKRFQLVLAALPLITTDLEPINPLVDQPLEELSLRFWLPRSQAYQRSFNCFLNGQLTQTRFQANATTVSLPPPGLIDDPAWRQRLPVMIVTMTPPLTQATLNEQRLNCTYPSDLKQEGTRRYHWFGSAFFINTPAS